MMLSSKKEITNENEILADKRSNIKYLIRTLNIIDFFFFLVLFFIRNFKFHINFHIESDGIQ